MLTATLAALFVAALFAVSASLQHRSAGLVTEADTLRTARLGGFISGTLRHPMWIAGSAAAFLAINVGVRYRLFPPNFTRPNFWYRRPRWKS